MSNKSMVKRISRGGKSCNKCGQEIPSGVQYWSGPYKSLDLKCYDIEADEQNVVVESAANDQGYVISGNCEYCALDAIGILWTKKVCAAHINQAITDNI